MRRDVPPPARLCLRLAPATLWLCRLHLPRKPPSAGQSSVELADGMQRAL